VTISLSERGIRAIVLDIEGTTTPIAFVHDVLFPYARQRLRAAIKNHAVSTVGYNWMKRLEAEWRAEPHDADGLPPWQDETFEVLTTSATRYCEWLMDRDRKSPVLKTLQGLIWRDGYEAGELKSNVFPDVPPALDRWRKAGITIAIYSSGSVLAQKLLFGASDFGNLTRLIDRFFDTDMGAKTSAESYTRIAGELGRAPGEVLFVSDIAAELEAARAAGMHVALSVRPGNPPQPAIESQVVHSLDEVEQ
jgi:enolase-phosphatase E1